MENSETAIPKTSTSPKKIKKPWYNDNCDEAIKNRKKALKQFNLSPTHTNLDNYRKMKIKALPPKPEGAKTKDQGNLVFTF